MNARVTLGLGLALTMLGMTARADTDDIWLTTKAKTALLTTDGLSVRGVDVETVDGTVILHGKVRTAAEKEKAGLAVRAVGGVKSIRNLIQVVPDVFSDGAKADDEAIRTGVEAALNSDRPLLGIKVTSVNNGVVLLSGRTVSVTEKVRAIELAWNIAGVSRVASDIETIR
jgi:osmotically-inducible protein OsmY